MIPYGKKRGKRCIATIHGLDWKRSKWGGFATKFLLYGERMAVEHADEIIVLSEADQQYFKEKYKRRTTLIPNGINTPEYFPPKSIKLKHALNGEDYILFVARIVPEKGVHTLVEAYSKSGIEVPLVIAGGSSHSEEYYRTIKAFADKFNDKASRARRKARIVMTGFVQGRELEELYGNAVMYVLPSEIEGMPISLLEAMSYGNICLVSDIPENTAVVAQHGYCFANKDVESLRDSMRDIIGHLKEIREDPNYSKEAIARHVLEQYDWDRVVKQTLALYKGGKED
jgi:glycosyltransferase involved in cell wall biosynthesis